jgi:hypothetical protein
MGYFYTITTDPKVKAAGYDLLKVGRALLDCVVEDTPNVLRYALKGQAERSEKQVRGFTRGAAATVLGGVVHPEIEDQLKNTLDAAVKVGFQKFGEWIEKGLREKAKVK